MRSPMSVSCHRRFLAVAAVLLLASYAFAQESASGVPFAGSPARRPVPLAARAAADLAPAAMLAPAREAAADELLAMMEHNAGGKVPVQNGFARALDPVPVRLGFTELANRFPAHIAKGLVDLSPDGDRLVWTAVIQVSEANAIRLHLSEVQLPDGAGVLVYSDVDHVLGPFDLGLRDPLGGMWLPAVGGGRATIEVQVPVNALIGGGAVSFTIDKVAELFGNSDTPQQPSSASKVRANAAPLPGKIGVNTPPPCLVDGNCVTSSTLSVISDYRYSVAQLQYMKSDGSYLCSCRLVNDADPISYIRYLI